MKRFLLLLGTGGVSFALVGGFFLLNVRGSEATAPNYGAPPVSTYTLAKAKSFRGWALYNVGDSFEGLPLVAVRRDSVTAPVDPAVTKIRPNDVSFIYGDCTPDGGDGCAPPLEIQISPVSAYTPADIDLPADGRQVVRGVNGVFYQGGAKLVLVTGSSTVAIYGTSRAAVLRAAAALRGVNVGVGRLQSLPAPVSDD